ncbi:hypothetical protein [Pseudomonas sp. P9(2020)]|uniref:hypothetical protein n=1 Tax=Pseudomonas sp. P9(2020) TaxID=2763316 RepID=UPI001B33D02E|nr:hypothetical protein [Pseudomonas sp. P9(2020)]MBP5947961.1 hypothetical protein [Pseudomonas sp. P9(2020)]
MDKFTDLPEVDGLFWYFEKGVEDPRPVMIDQARWGVRAQITLTADAAKYFN